MRGVLLASAIVAVVLTASAVSASSARAQEAQAPAATGAAQAEQLRQEAEVLFREVMSPFCPGLTLADCPSPAAFDLRRDIQARLERGESRDAIVDGLVARYGAQLLSDPSDTPIGRVVWGVPIALSALAALALAVFVRRMTHAQSSNGSEGTGPSPDVRKRLEEELEALD